VKDSKEEIGKVHFELQLHIFELQLKLQPTAPPKFREQRKASIKEDMTTLENAVKDCI